MVTKDLNLFAHIKVIKFAVKTLLLFIITLLIHLDFMRSDLSRDR